MAESSLFEKLLGATWHALPAPLADLHRCEHAAGSARVTRGSGRLARCIAAVFRFPAAAEQVDVTVDMVADPDGQTWTRHFGQRAMRSRLSAGRGRQEDLLVERFGPMSFAMALVLEQDCLHYVVRQWCFLGLSMPISWAPHTVSTESVRDGRFCFDIRIAHPLAGLIVHYRGTLAPVGKTAQ